MAMSPRMPSRAARARLSGVLVGVALAALAGCGEQRPGPSPSPRAVFVISIDTLRQDHVGHYGYERDTTPVLDELARTSLVFERAYTTASFTLIAHMSMLTGLYPFQHGVLTPKNALSEEVPTLAQHMRAAGYHTIGFYFPGWLDEHYGFGRGFDHYESHRTAEEAQEHLFAALAKLPADKPLFCFVHLFDVHNAALVNGLETMYDPPAPFDLMFVPDARQRLQGADPRLAWKRDSAAVSPGQHEAIVGMYDGGIRHIDTVLGEWIAHLRELDLFEDSLFIVTSDHGEGLNQRGSKYGGHGGAFEEGLVVPLLMRFPGGSRGGERVGRPMSHVDLLPTILDSLGLERDERLAGYSALAGRPEEALIFAERPETDTILHWPWKMTRKCDDGRTFLYNLETDPLELLNLNHANRGLEARQTVESLEKRALQARSSRFQPRAQGEQADLRSEETRALLGDLGYVDDSD